MKRSKLPTSLRKRKSKKIGRDYSKYMLDGHVYGKSKLVLAVVKKYVKKHPGATVRELQTVFPKSEVHAPFDVVVPVKKAVPGRFFLGATDIIKIDHTKAAVTTQWGAHNIEDFISCAKKRMRLNIRKLKPEEAEALAA